MNAAHGSPDQHNDFAETVGPGQGVRHDVGGGTLTAKLDYKCNLRELMARQGMLQTTHQRPKLAERGIVWSDSQVYRLVVDKPERLNLKRCWR